MLLRFGFCKLLRRQCALSREPAPSLPGGFILGEYLYFTGEDQIVGRGIFVRGSRGEVVGLRLEPDSLAMRFSNKALFSG